jgi:hypothetical protein
MPWQILFTVQPPNITDFVLQPSVPANANRKSKNVQYSLFLGGQGSSLLGGVSWKSLQQSHSKLSRAKEFTQEQGLDRQPLEPVLYMKYTISQDMSKCTEAQEKTRLVAIHDRSSPFISKNGRLAQNSADQIR